MRQRRQPDFHSRFDVPDQPQGRGLWARLRYEVQRQVLLTFYPHPDSFYYSTRPRLLTASALVFFGAVILGAYWWSAKRSFVPFYTGMLGCMMALGLLFFIKVYFRLLPGLKDSFIFPGVLWISLPMFFFLDYFFLQGRTPSSEHLAIMLLLYTGLLHWRVGGLGGVVAVLLAAGFYGLSGGTFFMPSDVDIFVLATAYVGGLLSSYTFAAADSQRYEQNARILHTVGKRLETALGAQLALSEALRHEASSATEGSTHRRLLDVAERLDVRANLTRAELQEMQSDTGQMQSLGGTQILKVHDLCHAAVGELERAYSLPPELVHERLHCHGDTHLVVQGEWGESVQMFASVLAMMLRAERAAKTANMAVDLYWQEQDGQVQVEIQRVGSLSTARPKGKGLGAWQQAKRQEALAEELLPAYSIYVLKKMGAQLRVGDLNEGSPMWLHISWPVAEVINNRLTGYRPLSLMKMYENQLM